MSIEVDEAKVILALSGAKVFSGELNDDLVSIHSDLVDREYNRLIGLHPKWDPEVLMSMAQKRAGRIDVVGREAVNKLTGLVKSILSND